MTNLSLLSFLVVSHRQLGYPHADKEGDAYAGAGVTRSSASTARTKNRTYKNMTCVTAGSNF
jgi:hypothetical protein